MFVHLFLSGDRSTVPRSPLKRGNGGTVWSGVSRLTVPRLTERFGTAERLFTWIPNLYIIGKEVGLIPVEILLTFLAVTERLGSY